MTFLTFHSIILPKRCTRVFLMYTITNEYFIDGAIPINVRWLEIGEQPPGSFHDHDFTEIVVITSGEAQHITNGGHCRIAVGDVLMLHPGTVHGFDRMVNFSIINLLFARDRIFIPILDSEPLPFIHRILMRGEHPSKTPNSPQPVMSLNEAGLKRVSEKLFMLLSENLEQRPGFQMAALSLLMSILLDLARLYGNPPQVRQCDYGIDKAMRSLSADLTRKPDIHKLAAISNMSERNFFRAFKRATGLTPGEYVMRLRLDKARSLLRETSQSIGEIATACGFYDSNHLCRIFRERLAVSPRNFRLGQEPADSPAPNRTAP